MIPPPPRTLCDLNSGETGRIAAIIGDRAAKRRCLALGLRIGTEVTTSQNRGQGIVVTCGGSRIALGQDMASRLQIEPVAASSSAGTDAVGND